MTLHITRLEPTLGAEIAGIDLRQPLTPTLRDELRQLLLTHKVLFFRDQAANNLFNVYPEKKGIKDWGGAYEYGQFSPFGFGGAYYYTRLAYNF